MFELLISSCLKTENKYVGMGEAISLLDSIITISLEVHPGKVHHYCMYNVCKIWMLQAIFYRSICFLRLKQSIDFDSEPAIVQKQVNHHDWSTILVSTLTYLLSSWLCID